MPLSNLAENPEHLRQLEDWMRSYRPEELFDETGTLIAELAALPPTGPARMSATPHTNGGELLQPLRLPNFGDYAITVDAPATVSHEATRVLGTFLRDVIRDNPHNFRLVGPDETLSNRLGAVFEETDRVWQGESLPTDEHLARAGG